MYKAKQASYIPMLYRYVALNGYIYSYIAMYVAI